MFAGQMRRAKSPGGGAAWDPTTPGNVLAWYFASTTYLFEDDAGTDAVENTDGVAVWKNRDNPTANNLIRLDASGDQPLFESTGWNGAQPSVIWDGSVDVLELTSGTMLTSVDGTDTPITVFATLQCTGGNQDASLFCWDNSGGNELMSIRTDNSGNNNLLIQRRDAGGTLVSQVGGQLAGNRVRIAMYFAGTTVTTWINGSLDINAASLNVGDLTTLNRFRMGNGNAGTFTGRITEMVAYTGDQSAHVGNYGTWSAATWGG